MAYVVNPGSVLQISIEGTANAQQFISLFNYRYTTGTAIVDGNASALAAINIFTAAGRERDKYVDCISDVVEDMRVFAQWITPLRYRYAIGPGAPFAGTVGAGHFPQNVSVAITKFGEEANRHSIGTLHMPAVPTTFLSAGMVNVVGALAYTALADILDGIIVLPTGQELAPCLFNKAAPNTSEIVIGAFVQRTSRVQRRRTVGLGT